jgi:ubiquinone/menaquinone biosynthesis C-methylase UbiE
MADSKHNDIVSDGARGPQNPPDAAQRESEYFDQFVAKEGDFNPFSPRGWNTLSRRFAEMVPVSGSLRLLDVGCGTGLSRQIYADKATDFIGMDLSAEAIRVAAAKFPDSTWIRGDACAMPFPDDHFDVVCFSSVLHHIPQFSQAVCEGYRVLRPGGYVFAFDPNLLHPAMAIIRHPRSWFYSPKGVSPNERPLLPSELRSAFLSAGFMDIRQRCQANIPYRKVAPELVNALLSFYNCVDWLLEQSGLGRWFGSFIVTVGRKRDVAL